MQRVVFEGLLHTRTNVCKMFHAAVKSYEWCPINDTAENRGLVDAMAETYIDLVEYEIHEAILSVDLDHSFAFNLESECMDVFDDSHSFLSDYLGVSTLPDGIVDFFDSVSSHLLCALSSVTLRQWLSIIEQYHSDLATTTKAMGAVGWIGSHGISTHSDSFYLLYMHDLKLVVEVSASGDDGQYMGNLRDVIEYFEGDLLTDYSCGNDLHVTMVNDVFRSSLHQDIDEDDNIKIYKLLRGKENANDN